MDNQFLIKLAVGGAEFLFGVVVGPLVKKGILRLRFKGVDQGVLTFLGSFASIFIILISAVIALAQIGVDISVITGAFSAVGLGISLSLKENMANVAGGMQILLTRPFVVGDYISCQGGEGTVEQIEIMFTTLKTIGQQMVVIPNSTLISNELTNYSSYPSRRMDLTIPAACFDDYDSLRKALLDLMKKDARILKDPAPVTVVNGFTADGNGMNIRMTCYTKLEDYWDTWFDLNAGVQRLRRQSAVGIPRDAIQIVDTDASRKGETA